MTFRLCRCFLKAHSIHPMTTHPVLATSWPSESRTVVQCDGGWEGEGGWWGFTFWIRNRVEADIELCWKMVVFFAMRGFLGVLLEYLTIKTSHASTSPDTPEIEFVLITNICVINNTITFITWSSFINHIYNRWMVLLSCRTEKNSYPFPRVLIYQKKSWVLGAIDLQKC